MSSKNNNKEDTSTNNKKFSFSNFSFFNNKDYEQISEPGNIFNFIKNLAIVTLFIILIIVLGSLIVYSGKVAQSNVLPTDINCFPYTSAVPSVAQIPININDHFVQGKILSQKIKFPYDKNASNIILDFLRQSRLSPNASGMMNYFVAILEGLFSFNYQAYNFLYDGLNYLPEILVLLIGPFITVIFSSILSLVDHLYLIYLWFSNFGWFFQQNENKSGVGSPSWKAISLFEPLNYFLSIFLSILFFLLFFVAFFSFFPLLTSIVIITCFITILSCTAIDSNNYKYNVFSCMKDSLKYNKNGIMTILSLCIILLTFSYFGPILALICSLVILLLYFNIIPLSVFTSGLPPNLSAVVSDKQASKNCNFENTTKSTNNNSSKNTNNNTNNNINNNTKNIFQKIGGFLPKFPQIFPTLNVVETYNTPLPPISYPKIEIEKIKLPDLKLPEEVQIKFPDLKLPEIKIPPAITNFVDNVKEKTYEGVNNAIIGAQDDALKGLDTVNNALKGNKSTKNNSSTPNTNKK